MRRSWRLAWILEAVTAPDGSPIELYLRLPLRLAEAMLETARNHLRPNGFAVIERYPPGWVATCAEQIIERDGVRFTLRNPSRDSEGVLSASMVYEFDGKRFEQHFRAREFDEALLAGFGHAYHLIP